jgi:hypothetical protein
MIKVIMLLKRRPGMSMAEFKDYYETRHSVLGTKNFPHMASYKRNYLTPVGDSAGAEPPFDCVTETCFATEEDYRASIAHFAADPARIAAHESDEENLFDRSKFWTFIVDECSTEL